MNGTSTTESIEFGGLVWLKKDQADSTQYSTRIGGEMAFIHQYSDGRWFWLAPSIHVDGLAVLNTEPSGIRDSMVEAMQSCMEAKNMLIADIEKVCGVLGIGDYGRGFTEGRAALAKQISEVMA